MLILPYSSELRLAKHPYVTYTIIMMCLVVFNLQQDNRKAVYKKISSYCQSLQEKEIKNNLAKDKRWDKESCINYLTDMNARPTLDDWIDYSKKIYKSNDTEEEQEKSAKYGLEHYSALKSKGIPYSLDVKLMYYPESYNPLRMLTSAISHADWSHIIFNLIFFFAFAPALEILAKSKLKFISLLIAIEIIGGLLYSILSMASNSNIPTLGLSGSVMGMIGFSAYMMPWARIRTLFVFITFARKLSIPASFLAAWYIGWDVYDLFTRTDNSSTNFIAHVSGGVSGYLIGFYFFKREKKEAEIELSDEIDFMRAKREDYYGTINTFKGNKAYVEGKQRDYEGRKAYGKYKDELYHLVKSGKTSDAMALIIKDYELYSGSPEIYEELFQEIGEWKKKRVFLCVGRLIIDLYIEKKKYGEISTVLKLCLDADNNFILGDPDSLLLITNKLISMHQPKLAYILIHNASTKYGDSINLLDCLRLEAIILWEYLNKADEAQKLLQKEISKNKPDQVVELNKLLTLMK